MSVYYRFYHLIGFYISYGHVEGWALGSYLGMNCSRDNDAIVNRSESEIFRYSLTYYLSSTGR